MVKSLEEAGGKTKVVFDHVGGGLVAKEDDGKFSTTAPVKGFALAGEDGKYVWAEASIAVEGVILTCDKVSKPVKVHHAWANHPVCNLFNREGFPASPFEMKVGSGM